MLLISTEHHANNICQYLAIRLSSSHAESQSALLESSSLHNDRNTSDQRALFEVETVSLSSQTTTSRCQYSTWHLNVTMTSQWSSCHEANNWLLFDLTTAAVDNKCTILTCITPNTPHCITEDQYSGDTWMVARENSRSINEMCVSRHRFTTAVFWTTNTTSPPLRCRYHNFT